MNGPKRGWEALVRGSPAAWDGILTRGSGPAGALPLDDGMLREWASGDLFGLTQAAGMGWPAAELSRENVLILTTQGGIRGEDGSPEALGYHTGHWEVGLLARAVARRLRELEYVPFCGMVSDPCDGRTQGTLGMMDSLPYRNDAAVVMRRLIRSLPRRRGVVGVATCDKGLPAMMLALAGSKGLAGVIVPGGVTLPPERGEDAGKVQSIGVRYVHNIITLEEAAEAGCRACGSPGGGCQFLGTAATSQVVAEAFGLTVPHAALAPSGQRVWYEMAERSADAIDGMMRVGLSVGDLITARSLRNAMVVHAAFGGSTNLLLHIPAIVHAAGLKRPSWEDWHEVNLRVPRIVSVLPNGPLDHPTVRVYLAGGVPEVMLHLRELGLLDTGTMTALGVELGAVLDCWAGSERRKRMRELLHEVDCVDPDTVIVPPARAREMGMTSTVAFPRGNLAPEGSVIKSTAIDPSVVDADGVYRHQGPARVFCRERDVMAAIKGQGVDPLKPGEVVVLIGRGPLGAGMEEIYQITSALRYLSFGRHVPVLTDARFSGVSTGACIGHIGPEALAGGPIGRLRDGDLIRIEVDRVGLRGSVDLAGADGQELDTAAAERLLAVRTAHPDLRPDVDLPADTRLWAILQAASGGTWGGCVYDVEAITEVLSLGLAALREGRKP